MLTSISGSQPGGQSFLCQRLGEVASMFSSLLIVRGRIASVVVLKSVTRIQGFKRINFLVIQYLVYGQMSSISV